MWRPPCPARSRPARAGTRSAAPCRRPAVGHPEAILACGAQAVAGALAGTFGVSVFRRVNLAHRVTVLSRIPVVRDVDILGGVTLGLLWHGLRGAREKRKEAPGGRNPHASQSTCTSLVAQPSVHWSPGQRLSNSFDRRAASWSPRHHALRTRKRGPGRGASTMFQVRRSMLVAVLLATTLMLSRAALAQQAQMQPDGRCAYEVPNGSLCYAATGECYLGTTFIGNYKTDCNATGAVAIASSVSTTAAPTGGGVQPELCELAGSSCASVRCCAETNTLLCNPNDEILPSCVGRRCRRWLLQRRGYSMLPRRIGDTEHGLSFVEPHVRLRRFFYVDRLGIGCR